MGMALFPYLTCGGRDLQTTGAIGFSLGVPVELGALACMLGIAEFRAAFTAEA